MEYFNSTVLLESPSITVKDLTVRIVLQVQRYMSHETMVSVHYLCKGKWEALTGTAQQVFEWGGGR